MEFARRDIQTLKRIVAMLMALAVLAEHAGSRSFPVRWLVLAILTQAEAVAQAFVVEATRTQWPDFEVETQSRPVDATVLAMRFRLLAVALGALLDLACLFDDWNARLHAALRRIAPCPGARPVTSGGSDPGPNDTS